MRHNIFKLTIFDNLLSKLLASYGFDTCSFDTAHCNFSTLSIFSLICSDYSPVIGWRDQLWKNHPVNAHCHPEQRPGLPVQLGGKRTKRAFKRLKCRTACLVSWQIDRYWIKFKKEIQPLCYCCTGSWPVQPQSPVNYWELTSINYCWVLITGPQSTIVVIGAD